VENLSASQVSEINKGLDEQVEAFRCRAINAEHPVIWVVALYGKIRDDGEAIPEAILVIYGVNLEGKREILAVEPLYEESEASWGSVFESLKAPGMQRVWLVFADAHRGIENETRRNLLCSTYQRCKVHLMLNFLARVSHKDKKSIAEKLKQIWIQQDRKSTVKTARIFMAEHRHRYPEAIELLSEGLEDSLQFFTFSKLDTR
jgi:transposase-like protein